MATHKSDQITNIEAVPVAPLKANEHYGRQRMSFFTFTVPTGNAAVNDVVRLCKLPKGARILGGAIAFEAMSTGAGDASVQLGVTGTATKYLGTTSVDAAGKATFADTIALNYGEELAAATELIATVITEAWAAGKKLYGHVKFVVD